MPLYKKKESLTSKYSKIPNVIYCEGMNAKLRLKLKRSLQKQVTASVESGHQRLLIQFSKL
jgi:hypothetical protein